MKIPRDKVDDSRTDFDLNPIGGPTTIRPDREDSYPKGNSYDGGGGGLENLWREENSVPRGEIPRDRRIRNILRSLSGGRPIGSGRLRCGSAFPHHHLKDPQVSPGRIRRCAVAGAPRE
jgi:hypothetical protein